MAAICCYFIVPENHLSSKASSRTVIVQLQGRNRTMTTSTKLAIFYKNSCRW